MAGLSSYQSHVKAFVLGVLLAILGVGGYYWVWPAASGSLPTVTVYKSPMCKCCSKWVSHLRSRGFPVEVESRVNVTPTKERLGVPSSLSACHTAVVGKYVVEGHVPAQDVKRLLRKGPDVAGLSVPGMPVGSPGMERGPRMEPYKVLAFTPAGDTRVFARYGPDK